ncbi:MAG TPA: hypothetical protein VN700_09420 [Vicinamibacterales bacterium]|nr:hypothetical protein [Vicinamibacterales bacterium]
MTGSTAFTLSYALLWALTLLLSFTTVLLLRDLARRRLVSADGRKRQGLAAGSLWSGVEVVTASGATKQLPEPNAAQVILVGAKQCALCRKALLVLGQVAAETGSSLRYLFVYPGTRDELFDHIGDVPSGITVVYDPANATRRDLGLVTYPYAMGIDASGRVRDGMVTHKREGFDSLISALGVK